MIPDPFAAPPSGPTTDPWWVTPAPDPFTDPPFDPATGELLDPDPILVDPVDVPAPTGLDPGALIISPPADVSTFARDLKDALHSRLTAHAEALYAGRHGKDAAPTPADVQVEIVALNSAREALEAVGKAFTATAATAREYLQDIVLDVRGDEVDREGGSRSVKVGSPIGAVKVTVTGPTETSVDEDTVIDVLVGEAVQAALAGDPDAEPARLAAQAARVAIAGYREVSSPPKWKITALAALQRRLEGAGRAAVAQKLAGAVGRARKGALRTAVSYPDEG